MGRGKNKQKQQQPQTIHIEELEIENKVEIDYKKLALAIIEAQVMFENEKLKQQISQSEETFKKRNEILGRKDYSDERRWIVRKPKEVINTIVVTFKTLFIKKKDAQYLSGANMLFQSLTTIFFAFVRYALYAVALYLVWHGITNNEYVTHGVWSVAAFIYAQIFRVIQFEIERMQDREYLMAIFAAIVSVLSLVASIILR